MRLRIFFQVVGFILLLNQTSFAQKDSIIFKNGEYLIGVIQQMDRGILEVETNYSDSDFKVEWDKISEIYVRNIFLINLKNGEAYNGSFKGKADSIQISTYEYGTLITRLNDIVFLKGIDEGFKDRFVYSIDIGFSLTKANNLRNFSSSSKIGYSARKWSLLGSFSSIISDQDDQDETRNTDGSITFRYILHKGWYLFPEMVFLSNTQQNLDLRTTSKFGAGNYFTRTNRAYWSAFGGISNTQETFSGETSDRNSWEAFFGTDLNLFNIGDFNLSMNANAYPSLTEEDRFRLDANVNIKYDLPLDFYIKLGTTYNFDNQPAEGGSKSNYTIQTGIGWEY